MHAAVISSAPPHGSAVAARPSPLRRAPLRVAARAAAPAAAPKHAPPATARAVFTVELELPNGRVSSIRVATDGPSIYEAASHAGVPLPASCRQGSCTACCARVVDGKVKVDPHQTCVPASLARQGYVALCCARPASDLRVQTHQGRAVREANQSEAPKRKW